MKNHTINNALKQSGFTLFASLIFLVILTMLGVSMFSGFTQDQLIAGNVREKARALDSAQTLLNTAQAWMAVPGNTYVGGGWITGQDCTSLSAITVSNTSTNQVVCTGAISSPTTLPWTGFRMNSTLTGLTVSTTGGVSTYAANPSYHMQYISATNANPPTAIYKVTATGQGGNADAVAVVQAVYEIKAKHRDLGN
jgi:type IV pilus assembly protein PilX